MISRKMSRWTTGAALGTAVLLSVAACSGSAPETARSADPEPEVQAETEPEVQSEPLNISAAASLQAVFDPLLEEFSALHPDIEVGPVNFDGSSTLVTQIQGGDPVDVFASADEANMAALEEAGDLASPPQIFATNSITVAVPVDNPAGLTSWEQVADDGVSVVICAPEVPCGASTQRLLDSEGLSVLAQSEEQNVSAVATKVGAGEADAGFVYRTDILSRTDELLEVPAPAIEPNLYPVAVLKDAPNPDAAKLFTEFLLSPAAREILEEFGFGLP